MDVAKTGVADDEVVHSAHPGLELELVVIDVAKTGVADDEVVHSAHPALELVVWLVAKTGVEEAVVEAVVQYTHSV